jgi:hypothetical protein
MWWVVLTALLSVSMLIMVTVITLVGLLTIADPRMLARCRECARPRLDFHRTEGICHRCRHAHPPVEGLAHHPLRWWIASVGYWGGRG